MPFELFEFKSFKWLVITSASEINCEIKVKLTVKLIIVNLISQL